MTKLIPHFYKYPPLLFALRPLAGWCGAGNRSSGQQLKTKKHSDYLLFKEAVIILQRGEHLTIEGIQKIVNIRASLNKGRASPATVLKTAFPNSIPFSILPVPLNNTKLHPQWIAGFTSGDGCFKISIRDSKLYKAVSPVAILFILTQHIRDELLLKSFIDFFDCGHTYSYLNYIEFKCHSFKDNYAKILPFFKKYPILGVKAQDFEDWKKVAEMMKSKNI